MPKKAIHTKHISPKTIGKKGYRTNFFSQYNFKTFQVPVAFYEFGVFSGKSMIEMLDVFSNLNINLSDVYGFDSFQGLPKCTEEPVYYNQWKEGEFNTCSYLEVDDVELASRTIFEEVSKSLYRKTINMKFFNGYFEETFANINAEKLTPALFIDIDVDLYSSAKQVLSFMLKNNLIIPGTVINYDDWGESTDPHNKNETAGESRAHKEACEEWNLKCKLIKNAGGQRAYVVVAV